MFSLVPRRSSIACAFFTFVVLSGCATITGGSGQQKVKVASDPPGARVVVDGRSCGVTPTTLSLDRKVNHRIQLEKSGYALAETDLRPGVNPWIFGNVIIGGLIGVVVDLATNSDRRLYPKEVEAHLAPVTEPASVLTSPLPMQ